MPDYILRSYILQICKEIKTSVKSTFISHTENLFAKNAIKIVDKSIHPHNFGSLFCDVK